MTTLKDHTPPKECVQFEAVCDEYSIKNKLDYIVSDNMRIVFAVCFPNEQEDDVHNQDHLDNPEL